MNTAIIVAGGTGKRMKAKVNKILLSLLDKPIIYHTIKKFEDSESIDNIIIVINKDDKDEINNIVKDFKKVSLVVEGGKERQDSVYNGIKAYSGDDEDILLIHNAANPFLSEETIKNIIDETKKYGCAVAAIKAKDTIKEVKDGFVVKTLDRERLWQMQTPQAMKFGIAKKAFSSAYSEAYHATDDVALVEKIGEKVKIVETNPQNIKITTPEDMKIAEKLMNSARVGLGMDSHKFEEGKELYLGGIKIPDETGFRANSDGDVILHALFNAISQALGKRSIGCYADKMCLSEGITDSKEYLKIILDKLEGYKINSVGIMLEGKKPRLEKWHDKIKESIARLLNIDVTKIGLTFTSGEELTSFGKGEGMQCFVVVSLL